MHVAFILGLKFARRINRDVINGDSAARGGIKFRLISHINLFENDERFGLRCTPKGHLSPM